MSTRYNQSFGDAETHFSDAVRGELDYSKFTSSPVHITSFNAGRLVPIYCAEVLPDDTWEMDVDAVLRQTTVLTPTMGKMFVDIYAFFVPNRVVNKSFASVMGENETSSWTAPTVTLAPLLAENSTSFVQIPVHSVADYYGFPTQQPIPASILSQCNDLKFRGYVSIYNEYFRDQNYEPPIPMSLLNVYQGFLHSRTPNLALDGIASAGTSSVVYNFSNSDNAFGANSVAQAVYGSSGSISGSFSFPTASLVGRFSAIEPPLKVNKLHDYFTSVLPSPQKADALFIPVSGTVGSVPVVTSPSSRYNSGVGLIWRVPGDSASNQYLDLKLSPQMTGSDVGARSTVVGTDASTNDGGTAYPVNLVTLDDAPVTGLAVSINDLRMSSALQQYAECLALGGSRYREFVKSFFGLEVDDPFSDIPQYLGHIRRDLDLYQTAQTSASVEGSTPQGHLSAFGYTSTGGSLFKQRFLEHGYVHVFAVVRHKNLYSSYMAPDNFRMSSLDFYSPQLANISEQPVYTKYINPFAPNADSSVFGYNEAWAEYRYDPDCVSGAMRPGVSNSLAIWNYADDFSQNLSIADVNWLKSNSETVLNRTLATTTDVQLYGYFNFHITKGRAMPIYSLPGMDII